MKPDAAARTAAHFYENHADYREGQAVAVMDAIRAYVHHGVPSEGEYAVVDVGDGLPLVLALADDRLYVITVKNLPEDAPPTVSCRVLRFTAQNCSVRIEARFSSSHAFGFGLRAIWTIVVADPGGPMEFELSGQIDSDGEPNVEAEFGLLLAQALGVASPRPGDR